MVWNDVADRKVDAVQRPERPLPRGDVSLRFAVALGTLLIAAGISLSPCRVHHAVIAALVLAYDFGSKRVPVLAVLGMGVLRALNLGTALAIAGTLEHPAATEALVAAACYGVYIVAVTVLGIFEDRPGIRRQDATSVQVLPPVVALAGVAIVQGGVWPAPVVALLPAAWFLRRVLAVPTWDQRAIRGSMMHLLLGTMLYTALLALAAGQPVAAAGIVLAIVPARWIARRIALT
jgi:4-hydroxybenzoate polyprenyltransferase